MTAPFRDSTEAQIAAPKDRLEALDIEVKTLRQRPAVEAEAKPATGAAKDVVFAHFIIRVLAVDVAAAWGLAWACDRFGSPGWMIAGDIFTGIALFIGSLAILAARSPS